MQCVYSSVQRACTTHQPTPANRCARAYPGPCTRRGMGYLPKICRVAKACPCAFCRASWPCCWARLSAPHATCRANLTLDEAATWLCLCVRAAVCRATHGRGGAISTHARYCACRARRTARRAGCCGPALQVCRAARDAQRRGRGSSMLHQGTASTAGQQARCQTHRAPPTRCPARSSAAGRPQGARPSAKDAAQKSGTETPHTHKQAHPSCAPRRTHYAAAASPPPHLAPTFPPPDFAQRKATAVVMNPVFFVEKNTKLSPAFTGARWPDSSTQAAASSVL